MNLLNKHLDYQVGYLVTSPPALAAIGSGPENIQRDALQPSVPLIKGSSAHEQHLVLLVVDADEQVRSTCHQVALGLGFDVFTAADMLTARKILRSEHIDIILMDDTTCERIPGGSRSLAETARARDADTSLVVMTSNPTVASAVEAMHAGARHYICKPFNLSQLVESLNYAAERPLIQVERRRLQGELRGQESRGALVGQSTRMTELCRMISRVAKGRHVVMIYGVEGTGKESVAQSIHSNGYGADRPFIVYDCRNKTPESMEGDLLGCYNGSNPAGGLLSAQEGGSVLLNNIEELSLELQGKLFQILKSHMVSPIGSSTLVPLSVRIFVATGSDLEKQTRQGLFRRDLYQRLNVFKLVIPALQDRRSDIGLLGEYFVEKFSRQQGATYSLSFEAFKALAFYDWPGDLHEFGEVIEGACSLSCGNVIRLADLPDRIKELSLAHHALPQVSKTVIVQDSFTNGPLKTMAEIEKEAIIETIERVKGDKLAAAKALGLGKTTLYRKLKEYALGESNDTSYNDAA